MAKDSRIHLFLFLLLFSAVALLVATGPSQGRGSVLSDDFTGNDGSDPDPLKWTVFEEHSNDYVDIQSNTLRTSVTNSGRAYIKTVSGHDVQELTLLLEWQPKVIDGRFLDVRLLVNETGTEELWLGLYYDRNNGWHGKVQRGGSIQTWKSSTTNVAVDTWYVINVTIEGTKYNVSVKRRDNGASVFSRQDSSMDTFDGEVTFTVGVFGGFAQQDPRANYDNLELYDNEIPPNVPPVWSSTPSLSAVEAVPFTYNFTGNVTDPDGGASELRITSHSPFVMATDGLGATFLFPNGITAVSVPLVLSDSFAQVVADVEFTVLPVNDPPAHNVPVDHIAVEDIPYTVDFWPHVWDVDNTKEELGLEAFGTYATVSAFNLTVTFPEGIVFHEVWVNVSDGLLSTPVRLKFSVTPVDDPPVIDPLGTFEVPEDQLTVFNVTPFLHDVDTPVPELSLIVRNDNCTVVGQEVHMLYTLGGIADRVRVQVTDGHSISERVLLVNVTERNDPPVVHSPSHKLLTEGKDRTIDLSAYIEDEDTHRGMLVLESDHFAVMGIDGFNITLLYEKWVPEHEVHFSVFDGVARTKSSFLVQVEAVNDVPVVTGIGDLEAPYFIIIDEDSALWFTIHVEDEDSDTFIYSIESTWDGIIAFTNGTLRVIAEWNEIAEYNALLTVDDRDGGAVTVDLEIKVHNVNDPPSIPMITDFRGRYQFHNPTQVRRPTRT